jgi:SAM-dependent methyltransferase
MTTRFDFETSFRLEDAPDVQAAIRLTIFNYMQQQLGWSTEECEERFELEQRRSIPKSTLDGLEKREWGFQGARVLDVGSGQGGGLLELLARGADAHGVEPGTEFAALSRRRLAEAGHSPERVLQASGEDLPFPDDYFDYLISLQVLEHVADPEPVIREMFRVLKPGGRCYISCENYLSFREQHYRLPWLPMLPKTLGSAYLRLLGKNPEFLKKYVFYTTYPQIWRICRRAGFENLTCAPLVDRLHTLRKTNQTPNGMLARLLVRLPEEVSVPMIQWFYHTDNFWRVGVRVHLRKPPRQ